jgi:hypothetical protein
MTFGSTWAISSLLQKALLDVLTLPLDVASSAIQANWLTRSEVARMTMHSV